MESTKWQHLLDSDDRLRAAERSFRAHMDVANTLKYILELERSALTDARKRNAIFIARNNYLRANPSHRDHIFVNWSRTTTPYELDHISSSNLNDLIARRAQESIEFGWYQAPIIFHDGENVLSFIHSHCPFDADPSGRILQTMQRSHVALIGQAFHSLSIVDDWSGLFRSPYEYLGVQIYTANYTQARTIRVSWMPGPYWWRAGIL